MTGYRLQEQGGIPGWRLLRTIDCRNEPSLRKGEINFATAAANLGYTYLKNPSAIGVCVSTCNATPGCTGVVAPQRLFWRTYACVFVDGAAIARNRSRCIKSEYFNTLVKSEVMDANLYVNYKGAGRSRYAGR